MSKIKGRRHPHKELTVAKVKSLKESGMHADGEGLYLKIDKSGAKRWVQRLVIQGKRCDLGLGSATLVSLADARTLAVNNRAKARLGGDPLGDKQKQVSVLTFIKAAEKVHELNKPTWRNPKHADQWINSLTQYVFPQFGRKKLDKITSADVLNALTPIWTEKPETASRVRQRISAIIKWGIAQGWRTDNPCDSITKALPKQTKGNNRHQSLPYSEVACAIQTVNSSQANNNTKLAIEFLILTATRSGEVRNAVWSEINLKDTVWTIPAERMKAKKTHRIPLSNRCIEILKKARELNSDQELIFPGARAGRPLSDMTFSKLLKELNIQCVPHGFRSSFRVWASEQTNIPNQVCEFALAHVIKDKAEAAYQRSDLFEKRRTLMNLWEQFLE